MVTDGGLETDLIFHLGAALWGADQPTQTSPE
jgi:hypothetical protein